MINKTPPYPLAKLRVNRPLTGEGFYPLFLGESRREASFISLLWLFFFLFWLPGTPIL